MAIKGLCVESVLLSLLRLYAIIYPVDAMLVWVVSAKSRFLQMVIWMRPQPDCLLSPVVVSYSAATSGTFMSLAFVVCVFTYMIADKEYIYWGQSSSLSENGLSWIQRRDLTFQQWTHRRANIALYTAIDNVTGDRLYDVFRSKNSGTIPQYLSLDEDDMAEAQSTGGMRSVSKTDDRILQIILPHDPLAWTCAFRNRLHMWYTLETDRMSQRHRPRLHPSEHYESISIGERFAPTVCHVVVRCSDLTIETDTLLPNHRSVRFTKKRKRSVLCYDS